MTKVVHCKKEKYDVLIDRSTIYGNPYSHKKGTKAKFITKSRKESIKCFRKWIYTQPELIKQAKKELKDRILGCWCKPKAFHGDIWVEILDNSFLDEWF